MVLLLVINVKSRKVKGRKVKGSKSQRVEKSKGRRVFSFFSFDVRSSLFDVLSLVPS